MSEQFPYRSRPLTRTALAKYWCISRNRVEKVCEAMAGAVRSGERWRVPLKDLPIDYWFDSGLINRNDLAERIARHIARIHCTGVHSAPNQSSEHPVTAQQSPQTASEA